MTQTETHAARYVASLRPAMRPEAHRIATEHLAKGEHVADATAILRALAAATPARRRAVSLPSEWV